MADFFFATADGSDDGEYELAMPFILCRSEGGPYDDAAFVAGSTIGALEAEFSFCRMLSSVPHSRHMNDNYLDQADLVAMRHGFSMERGELDEGSGWRWVSFS